jgi:CHASE3 domain sensor protein
MVLAELAALNSAYGVVKAAIGNGAEIHNIVSKVSKWAGLVEEAESKHRSERTRKGAVGELEEALETWQTVKRIQEQEEELRNMIISTTGDLNAWNDIISIRTKLRKDKINRQKKAAARRRQLQENIAIGTLIFIIMGVFVAILVLFLLFSGFI